MKLVKILAILFLFLGIQFACNKNDSNDKNKPFIVLIGNPFMYWPLNTDFIDPGAKVYDVTETNDTIDISYRLTTTGDVKSNVEGTYELKYNASDVAGNAADEVVRSVTVLISK